MLNKLVASIIAVFILLGALVSCGAPSANNEGSAESGENDGKNENAVNEGNSENSANVGESDADNSAADSANADSRDGESEQTALTVGAEVGNLCPSRDLEKIGGDTVNIEDYRGKVVVVNIWGTWCPPCKNELPDFDRIASEYDDVVVIAVHSNSGRANAESYVNAHFPSSEIIFAYDTENEDYWSEVGGTRYYPRTVVLDKEGVITYGDDGALSYAALKSLVENAGGGK